MINKALFTSEKEDWETPDQYFEELNEEFHFDIDVAASHENAKLPRYFTKEDNALTRRWEGNVFCNPPYGRDLRKWVEKAHKEYLRDPNRVIVFLIPSRTDTSYWHDFIFDKATVRFLRGRLKFEVEGEPKDAAPFPSALVIYGKDQLTEDIPELSDQNGYFG